MYLENIYIFLFRFVLVEMLICNYLGKEAVICSCFDLHCFVLVLVATRWFCSGFDGLAMFLSYAVVWVQNTSLFGCFDLEVVVWEF